MPRYQHPQSKTRLYRILQEATEILESIDYHEPVAGKNRAVLQEASADLRWGVIYTERAWRTLNKWRTQQEPRTEDSPSGATPVADPP
jgi:hypothetical protein